MLAIFSTSSLLNATLWIAFAPVEPLVRTFYGVETWSVNMLSASFMILYPPGSLLGAYVMHRYGLRTSLLVGVGLQCAGSWLRYVGTELVHAEATALHAGFATLLVGQCLAGLAQPIFTNAPAKLAGEWFPAGERELATVAGALSNALGNAVGQVVPSLMVTCGRGGGDGVASDCAHVTGMERLCLVQAAVVSAAALWTALCFRAEPPTPPSRSASARRASRSQLLAVAAELRHAHASREVRGHYGALLHDGEFLKLLVGFGVGLGLFNGLLTDLGQLIQPLYCHHANATAGGGLVCDVERSSADAGLYGGVLIGAGVVGAGLVGAALDATHLYRAFLKGGFLLSLGGMALCVLALRPHGSALLAAGFGALGFCVMPLLPVALECSVECTFPVPEEASASLLMIAGNLIGLATTYGLQALIARAPVYQPGVVLTPAAVLLLGTVGLATLIVLGFNGQYKRLHADRVLCVAPTADPPADPAGGEAPSDAAASPAASTCTGAPASSPRLPTCDSTPASSSFAASSPEEGPGRPPPATPDEPAGAFLTPPNHSLKTPASRAWPSLD